MDERWIQQIREKVADYKRPAPEVSWEALDRALDAGMTRKVRLLWLRRMAAAAVFLLIAGGAYWGFLKNHGDWHNDSSVAKIRVPVPVIPNESSLTLEGLKPGISEEPVCVRRDSSFVATKEPSLTLAISPDTAISATPEETVPPSTTEEKAKPIDNIPSVIYPSDLHQRKHIDKRLTAKVYMSSTMANNRHTQLNKYSSFDHRPVVSDDTNSYHVHHRQPVRFGLSLRYRLDSRWSIESGLTYTYLSSDISITMDSVTTMTEQRLYYIGLPLNISYELWKSRAFGLYVTTGGTIEKRLDASPWQFSINGAVGAEYKLTNYFSLYAEPGLGYYFKDGSTTPTIYQDRPLNYNLSVGLRFNLK